MAHRESKTFEFGQIQEKLETYKRKMSMMEIRRFHANLILNDEDFAKFLHFSDKQFCRNLIYASPHCELLLLCWRSTQRSRIHNHKGSRCGMRIVRGVATETKFERTIHGLVYPVLTHELSVGSIVGSVNNDIHQISNLQCYGQDLVTLHLYSPPLHNMELFSLDSTNVEKSRDRFSWAYEI